MTTVDFEPDQLFLQGQVDHSSASLANSSSAKAAGLQETTEMVKTDDQEATTTTLTIDLDEEVEQNMIDLAGNITTTQLFIGLKAREQVELPCLLLWW